MYHFGRGLFTTVAAVLVYTVMQRCLVISTLFELRLFDTARSDLSIALMHVNVIMQKAYQSGRRQHFGL